MSFRRAATLPGQPPGCRVLACPQSPTAPPVAPSLSVTSLQSPRDEGRRTSALIMSHLNEPVRCFANSPAEGPSIISAWPLHCTPVPRGLAARMKTGAPICWRVLVGGQSRGGGVSISLLRRRRLCAPSPRRTPPSPTASMSCEKSILRNSTAGKGRPWSPPPLRGCLASPKAGCRGTPRRCHTSCRGDMPEPVPLSPWDWQHPEEMARCLANLRGTGRGHARHGGFQGAPSGPVQHGRLFKLGRAPNYVHSCFIISTEFQDRQKQARQQGQGRQQVAARSRCAPGAWKWPDGSRRCGLQPLSPSSEIPARKTPNGPKRPALL